MKKLFYILLIIPVLVLGQSTDQNYIKSTTYKQPTITPVSSPDVATANVQISYFDGLGRPIQQIAHMQSNSGKDIITHIEYDQYGRQTREYLPFVSTSASQNYLSSAQTDVLNFYASPSISTTGNANFEATNNPFSEKQLENSSLSRIFKQGSPGEAWGLPQTTGLTEDRSLKFEYLSNNDSDNVKLIYATATWNSSLGIYDIAINQNGNYTTNQLFKSIIKDENWVSGKNNTIEEFKDKEGKVVLKRTYNNTVAHDTYYIYDQFGNLTYVIPPLAEGVVSQTILDNLGHQYKYDYRNRLVEKKLPGKQWEFIVYDKLDHPVATGPAFSPYGDGSNGWMITQYDVFGRVTQIGWKNATVSETTRNTNQTSINSGSNPFVLGANDILLKNYYDNYSFTGAPSPMPTTLPTSSLPIVANLKGLPTGSWAKVLEDATATTAEVSYILYDTKYRPVQTKTTNYLGGYTELNTNLDWSGKALYTITKHKRTDADIELVVKDMFEYSPQDKLVLHKQQINSLPEQLITKNTYDELGQLISKNVGGTDVTGSIGLQKVDYSYNIRGWLKRINDINNIGADLFAFKINYNDAETATNLYNGNISETFWKTSSDNKLRKYDYSYDHLNRLLQSDYSKEGSTTFNSYLEHLSYDKNGNIQTLHRNGEMDTDGYQFENPIDDLTYLYDDINKNQLLRVFDATANPSGFKDDTDGTNIDIDVSEAPDYTYDLNGNMISDTNKGITNIIYNHLNLPVEIVFPTGKINYLYNAIGQKVKKTVTEGSTTTITDYLSGFQYKNKALQFFPHAEGYVNYGVIQSCPTCRVIPSFNYVYNYTDHLGNIRLSYSQDPATNVLKIIEENHYYPFGLKHSGYNSDQMMFSREGSTLRIRPVPPLFKTINNYRFENKEWQDELGLNVYDFHARNYMPDIGRTTTYDPLAEKFYDFSPQSFFNNNPLFFTDPTGMQSEGWGKDKEGKWHYHEGMQNGDKTFTANNYIDFRTDGSVIKNASINGGEVGNVKLGYGLNDVSYVKDNKFSIFDNSAYLISNGLTFSNELIPLDDYTNALKNGNFLYKYNGTTKLWKMNYFGGGRSNISSARLQMAKIETQFLGNLGKGLAYTSRGLTFFGFMSNELQYRSKLIDENQLLKGRLENTFSLAFPVASIGFIPGNYLGEKYQPEIVNQIRNENTTVNRSASWILNFFGLPASKEQQKTK